MLAASNSHKITMQPKKMPFLKSTLLLIVWLALVKAEQRCEVLKTSLSFSQEKAPRDLSGMLPVVVERVNRLLEGVVNVEVLWEGADFQGLVGDHIINCEVTRLASVVLPDSLQEGIISTDELGREVATQCFQVPFSITDTNECTLPQNHPMRHQCQEPSVCVNTIGSYECVCPRTDGRFPIDVDMRGGRGRGGLSLDLRSPDEERFFFETLFQEERTVWELAYNSSALTSCPLHSTTKDCCPHLAHSSEGKDCRAKFHCPTDPCASHNNNQNQCVPNAQCIRSDNPQEKPNYFCQCPEGLMGNGKICRADIDPKPEPKVTFDGHPTQETIKNNYYCGCTIPVVDACSGYPPCKNKHEVCVVGPDNAPRCDCKRGFIRHAKYGCVDETPPVLKLKNDPLNDHTLRLKQGDFYEEYGVEIHDVNAEDYKRSLKISYSHPLPKGCAINIGEFHVNYTVAMPWTKEGFVRITRRVMIDDIDECSVDVERFSKQCPELVPQCDTAAGAKCVNLVGSYACECPKYTTGDGFLPGARFGPAHVPKDYQGGTGCVDTSKPVIHLKGPNPKVFKICACGGLKGFISDKPMGADEALQSSQREQYENEIKEMIRQSRGAELCATHDNTNPNPSNCVEAYDETYKGRVTLSDRVVVGDPIRKSHLHWSVPYDVKDDAGNVAMTVYREVVVEEVDVDSLEASVKKEVKAAKDAEIKRAVDKAVFEERRRLESDNKRSGGMTVRDCPPCPKCDSAAVSSKKGERNVDLSICDRICEQRAQQCFVREDSYIIQALVLLEDYLPAQLVPPVLLCIVIFFSWKALQLLYRLFFNRDALFASNYDYTYDQERERNLQNSVTYFQGETPRQPQQNQQTPRQPMDSSFGNRSNGPPRASLSADRRDDGDFFFSSGKSSTGGFSPAGTMPFSPPTGTNGSHQQRNGSPWSDPNDIYADSTPKPRGKITPRKPDSDDAHRSPRFSS